MCEHMTRSSIRLLTFILSASKWKEKPHQVNISPTCKDLNEEFIFDIRLISPLHCCFDAAPPLEVWFHMTFNEKWSSTNVSVVACIWFSQSKPRCPSCLKTGICLFQETFLIKLLTSGSFKWFKEWFASEACTGFTLLGLKSHLSVISTC